MIAATVVLALVGRAVYDSWLDRQWERHQCAAFDQSTAPDIPDFVERPAVMEKVRRVIAETSTWYEVIVGNHGTGKSTIVQKIASETSEALYVLIPAGTDVESAVAKAIVEALGSPRPESFLRRVWEKLGAGEHCESAVISRIENCDTGDKPAGDTSTLRLCSLIVLRQGSKQNTNAPLCWS